MITTKIARIIATKIVGYGCSQLESDARRYLTGILLDVINKAPADRVEAEILDFLTLKMIDFSEKE